MPYQGKIYSFSLPYQFRIPSATSSQDGVMTAEQVQRLDSLTGPLGGDLDGTLPDPLVVGLQGRPFSAATPALGDVPRWNGMEWEPAPDAGSTLGGDATGPAGFNTVERIRNNPVAAGLLNATTDLGTAYLWDGVKFDAHHVLDDAAVFAVAPAPGDVGKIYRINAAGQQVLAQSDSEANSKGISGPWQGVPGYLPHAGMVLDVLFEAGLTAGNAPAPQKVALLSPTTVGLATTIEPSLAGQMICYLGIIEDATAYSALSGGICRVRWLPALPVGPLGVVPPLLSASAMMDDFIALTPSGSIGWQSGGLAAGAATTNIPSAATNGNPGWWQLGTGTTVGGRAWVFLGNSGLTGSVIIGNARGQAVEWDARIPTVSAGGETFFCVLGLGDNPNSGGSGNYAVAFRIEPSGTITCVVRSAGADVVGLTLATAVAVPAATNCRFVVEHDGTTCRFLFSTGGRTGVLTQLHSFPLASLPVAFATNPVGVIAKIQKSSGVTQRALLVDRVICNL